jgi:DNA polymerase-3 subunit gamma/tau
MTGTTSLSRQYRPARFADLVNQAHIRQTLEHEVAQEKIGHAYLFTGPRGVGKTTVARIFAKAINCPERSGSEPCDRCAICQEFREGRSLDLIEIDAASHTQVDHVREHIIPNARTRPTRAAFKVFIIDEVHMLSMSAFNALLKIIEEPPDYVVFIFATTEVDRVPETIISRCQRFDFHRLDEAALVQRMTTIAKAEKIDVETAVLASIAELADGSVRDAESLLGQVFSLGESKIDLAAASLILPHRDRARAAAFLAAVIAHEPGRAIEELNAAIDDGVATEHFYYDLIRISRIALRRVYDPQASDALAETLPSAVPADWIRLLRAFLELEPLIASSPIPQLPLELFAVEQSGLAQESSKPSSKDLPPAPPAPRVEKSQAPEVKKTSKKEVVPSADAMTEAPVVKTVNAAQRPEPSAVVGGALLDAQASRALWAGLLEKAQQTKQGLAVMLNVCRPKLVEEGRMLVECQFEFYRDRLNDPKNRNAVEELLREVSGRSIKFQCELSSEPIMAAPANDVGVVSLPASPAQQAPQPAPKSPKAAGDDVTTWDQVVEAFGA